MNADHATSFTAFYFCRWKACARDWTVTGADFADLEANGFEKVLGQIADHMEQEHADLTDNAKWVEILRSFGGANNMTLGPDCLHDQNGRCLDEYSDDCVEWAAHHAAERLVVITHRACECGHGQNEHHDASLPLDHYASGRYRIQPDDPSFCDGCVDEAALSRDAYHRFSAALDKSVE